MVEFLTLFLGLVSGNQLVELSVAENVARVELLVDEGVAGTAAAPPYRFKVDLGEALLPHRLEAIGYDADGAEIGRSEQLLNVPQPQISLRLVLLGVTDGGRPGLLVWRATADDPPRKIEVQIDDQPLEVTGGRHFVLPPLDDGIHVLTAEVELAGGASASATLLVGGTRGERLTSQLTAVPVRLPPGATLPPLAALQTWVRAGGEPLEVRAVEQRRGTVVVVRDGAARDALDVVGGERRFSPAEHVAAGNLGGQRTIRLLDPVNTDPGDRSTAGGAEGTRFPLSQPFTSGDGGVPRILSGMHRQNETAKMRKRIKEGGQRIADAVAAAGLVAAGSQATRAVVLVLGPDPEDRSQWDPATVRAFLRALNVPLFVWTPIRDSGIDDRAAHAAWGEVRDVTTSADLLAATAELVDELDRQRIFWVPGTVLPHRIALTPSLPGTELAD